MQRAVKSVPTVSARRLPDVIGLGGGVAGFLAGLVMVLLSPILSWFSGISVWAPPRLIAATWYGSSVLSETGFALGPVVVALVIHFLTSIVLGIIFGIVMNRVLHMTTDFGLPIYAGLAYGLIVFFVAYVIILPILNPVVRQNYVSSLVVQNVTFGLFLGIFYIMLRPKPYSYVGNDG